MLVIQCSLSEWLQKTRHDKRRALVLAQADVSIGYLRQLVCYQRKGAYRGSISLLRALSEASEEHTPEFVMSIEKLTGPDSAAA